MPTATTIVIAREDFSIPGGEEADEALRAEPEALESRFSACCARPGPTSSCSMSRANGAGTGMILKIRRQSSVPILVVCDAGSSNIEDHRIAGAASASLARSMWSASTRRCSTSCGSTATPRASPRHRRRRQPPAHQTGRRWRDHPAFDKNRVPPRLLLRQRRRSRSVTRHPTGKPPSRTAPDRAPLSRRLRI
jgi:hypothetical protein